MTIFPLYLYLYLYFFSSEIYSQNVTRLAYFGNVYKGIGLKLKLNILTQVSLCNIYISSNSPSSIFVTFSTTSTAAASISLRIDFLTRNFLSPSFESNLEIDLRKYLIYLESLSNFLIQPCWNLS